MSARSRQRLSPEEKAAVARAWVESVRSGTGENQAAFAQRHGLSSPRILRAWVRRFVPGTRWDPELRRAVADAIAALTNITEAMGRPADRVEPVSAEQPDSRPAPTAATKSTSGRFQFDDEEGSP